MKTLLIGDMTKIDELYCWLEKAEEIFDVELIISENELQSQYYDCKIEPITALGQTIYENYDIIFICSNFYDKIKNILLSCNENMNNIVPEKEICKYLSKADIMRYYENQSYYFKGVKTPECVQMNKFSYCNASAISSFDSETKLIIGKFCSIAQDTLFILGGEHRTDWCSTYPFNTIIEEFNDIKGHPRSKGNIIIGNDVWVASRCTILSGVHIGNGSVVAAGTLVNKDVEPYTVVGGNPAKVLRKRFDDQTIKKLEEIQWWNWEYEYIFDAVPILQSNHIDQLFHYYDCVVRKIP